MIVYPTNSESETVEFGKFLGECIRPFFSEGVIVFLNGKLGAGKTTLCRGVLRDFNYLGAVKSPTYTLVEPYLPNHQIGIVHFAGKNNDLIRNDKNFISKIRATDGSLVEMKLRFNN